MSDPEPNPDAEKCREALPLIVQAENHSADSGNPILSSCDPK